MSLSRTLPTIALLFAPNACVGGNAPEDPYDLGAGSPEISAGGSNSLKGPVPEAGSRDSHFPLIDGARYTYRHTNLIDDPWEETQTIVGVRHEGEDTFTLSDQEDAEGEQTHSTLVAQGTRVYRRYKEVEVSGTVVVQTSYDPPFLRYDEAWRSAGDSVTLDDDWAQTCVVASSADNCAPGAVKVGTTSHRYTVLAIDEEVEVPAGRFTVVKIQRDNLSDPETKLFWFASGVGKLREENPTTGAVTELTAHDLP